MDEKELWDKFGEVQKSKGFTLGPHFSYQIRKSPRHMIFSLSRYKFAVKMIGNNKEILELGCSDGLGSYYLSEFAKSVDGIDFDESSISWAKENLENEKMHFKCENFLDKKFGEYDAIVSYDVIEHIYQENEKKFFDTIVNNLKSDGILVIGTPNIESERFSNKEISGAHVNMYSGERLVEVLSKYFNNVFLFSQNDEMIHTGFYHLSHYLICLCCFKKEK